MTFAVGFLGFKAVNIVNPLVGGIASSFVVDPADAQAFWRFNPDGTVDRKNTGGTTANQQQWYRPTGGTPGTGYWIRCTVNSGTTPTGSATGSWLQLNAARTWQHDQTVIGTVTCTLTIEIASDSGGANIVSSGSFTITADVST